MFTPRALPPRGDDLSAPRSARGALQEHVLAAKSEPARAEALRHVIASLAALFDE